MAEPIAALADAVEAIAREAGALAMARWDAGFAHWDKVPGQPVSEVDLAVDALLREQLAVLLPDAGWLSEETLDRPDRIGRARTWIVDPIDGTRDYVRRRPGWAVSIALVEAGRPVIGVLHAPARGELWRATAAAGATRNGERIATSARTELAGARVPVDALPRADRDLVVVHKPNSIALRIAMVAAGEADLITTRRWGYEWDIAAAVLVAIEAGAAVTDARGQPFCFNQPDPRALGVLVSAPALHAAALERFQVGAG